VILVTRETHEAPASVQERVARAGGRNRFGEPNFRVVWGGSRLAWIGGRWTDRDAHGNITREIIELRHVPKYAATERWHIERWTPPESYGAPAQWYAQTTEIEDGSGGGMLNLQPSSYSRLWEWREDKINLIGATQGITVRVRYEKILPVLTLGTDPVQIRSATDPLAFATAALAARSRGARALAADLLGNAQMATEKLIERYVRPEQAKARRRKPYSYQRRVVYL